MLGEYQTFLPLIALIWTILAFIFGHFIGHRAAIKRDRRKEYNSLASPVRIELKKQIESIKIDDFYTVRFKEDQVLLIADMLSARKERKLISAYKKYKHATSYEGLGCTVGEYGLIHIGDTGPALAAAQQMLKLIPTK